MKLPQLLHSTRSCGRANSAFSWKLPVLERGFLSYRLKSSCDRSERDAWFGYSLAGVLKKLLFILYSRPAEDWLRRSGSSSTILPTTLFFAIAASGRRNCRRSPTHRGSREYATTPVSMPLRCGTSCVSRGTATDRRAISNVPLRRATREPATAFNAKRSSEAERAIVGSATRLGR